jgi:pimeloyl-ACP methyl ester carboxylesterase
MDRLIAALPGLFTLLGTGFALALLASVIYIFHKLRTPPRRTVAWAISNSTASDPSELDSPLDFDSWKLTSQRGEYRGLAFPVWDITGLCPTGPTIILTPGWGDSRVGALQRVQHLAPTCARVIAWDPPGLGQAPGKTSLGVHEPDLLLQLIESLDTKPEHIVLYGSSMGAGISIAAAARCSSTLLGVIAEAPYQLAHTPAYNVLRESGIPWKISGPIAFAFLGARVGVGARWRSYDRAALAAQLRCPLLVIHGTSDTTCPVNDGKTIANAAPQGTLVEIPDAGHNNLWNEEPHTAACASACADFMHTLASSTGTPVASSG